MLFLCNENKMRNKLEQADRFEHRHIAKTLPARNKCTGGRFGPVRRGFLHSMDPPLLHNRYCKRHRSTYENTAFEYRSTPIQQDCLWRPD